MACPVWLGGEVLPMVRGGGRLLWSHRRLPGEAGAVQKRAGERVCQGGTELEGKAVLTAWFLKQCCLNCS